MIFAEEGDALTHTRNPICLLSVSISFVRIKPPTRRKSENAAPPLKRLYQKNPGQVKQRTAEAVFCQNLGINPDDRKESVYLDVMEESLIHTVDIGFIDHLIGARRVKSSVSQHRCGNVLAFGIVYGNFDVVNFRVAAVLFRLSAQPSEVRALGFGEQSEPTCI